MARLEGLSITEAFWPRLTSGSYIFTDFRLEKLRKQPYFEGNSAGWRRARGAFGSPEPSSIPAEYVSGIGSVFGRFEFGSY